MSRDFDLMKIGICKHFEQLQEILAAEGPTLDKVAAVEYMLERLIDVEMPKPAELINPEASSLDYLRAVKRQLVFDKQTLTTGLWERMPHESTLLYHKLFPDPIGDEAEQCQTRWNDAHSACLERGGPWKHHVCGEVFPMPPSFPPICPKCDLRGWERVLEAYKSEKNLAYKSLQDRIAEASEIQRRTQELSAAGYENYEVSQENAWPHLCPNCGGPAYCGLNAVTCKNGCS